MHGVNVTTFAKEVNRLIVYFWDADGIVDNYVIHALTSLHDYASKIVVVVNGHVNEDGLNKLRSVSNTLILRDNYGLDAWAYKAAFEQLGYEYIASFDEVLVTNFTLYGPVIPLSDMFKKWMQLHVICGASLAIIRKRPMGQRFSTFNLFCFLSQVLNFH